MTIAAKTTREVVGFEGGHADGVGAAWGAAAIKEVDKTGEYLLNGATALRLPYTKEEVTRLVSIGALTFLPSAIAIRFQRPDRPVVLEIGSEDLRELGSPIPSKTGLLGQLEHSATLFYVFSDASRFQAFADLVVDRIIALVLREVGLQVERRRSLIDLASVLNPHHYAVNALSIVDAENAAALEVVARASVRPESDLEKFDLMLKGLTIKKDQSYQLKYEDGVADGGGLNVDDAERIMGSLVDVHGFLAKRVVTRFPFITEPPANRFYEMKAASATLQFRPYIEGESLGTRLGRYVELSLLQEVLDGKIPAEFVNTPKMADALDTLSQPNANKPTEVAYSELDTDTTVVTEAARQFKAIEPRAAAAEDEKEYAGAKWSEPLSLLGFQAGIYDEGRRLELSISPTFVLRISAERDRNGDPHQGEADRVAKSNDYLFRPAVFTVVREHEGNRRARYHLVDAALLKSGAEFSFNAMPSAVVKGAFIHNLKEKLNLTRNVLSLSLGDISGVDTHTIDGARFWLAKYAELCAAFEIKDLRHSWLAPLAMRPTTELAMLAALLEGPATHAVLVQRLREMFPKLAVKPFVVRGRREDLFTFTRDNSLFGLTDVGERHARAFAAIQRRYV